MKDYYGILGLKKNATFYHITEAYRELSVTYHPDNHEGNEEYVAKYNDIQEAYEILSHGIKRRDYDNYISHLSKSKAEIANNANNAIPSIEFFKTDKAEFEYGEEITFSWKTFNADKVNLVPFGKVEPMGSYTHKIKIYKNKQLTFELIAENTLNGREAKASVSLKNKKYEEFLDHFKNELKDELQPAPATSIDIEDDHLRFIPRKKEKEPEFFSNAARRKDKQKVERVVNEIPKKQEVIKPEKTESNVLLSIVIMFLIIGFSILIYLGFFM